MLIDDTIDYVHWVAYNVPASATGFAEGASNTGQLPAGTVEAEGFGGDSDHGPCPGQPHTYTFRLYALPRASVELTASDPIVGADLDAAFGDALELATLTGTFTPP